MEHVLWAFIVIFVSQGPQGEMRIDTEVVGSTFKQQECAEWVDEKVKEMGSVPPNVKIGCMPIKHPMIF